jgi:tetratricopeptide (TPR) repeat protein
MPWQAVLLLLVLMPVVPLLILRCLPWLIVILLKVTSLLMELIAKYLLFFECLLTQNIRKKKREIPEILYTVGDVFAIFVRFIQSLQLGSQSLSKSVFSIPWILRPKILYALPFFILILIWFLRPYMGNSGFTKLIDSSFSSWCSLEHWIMAGEWIPSKLTCRYPNSSPKWEDTQLKYKEYEVKNKIKEYTTKIKSQPSIPDLYYKRGNAYLNIEDTKAAFSDYNSSVKIDQNFAPGYVARGNIFLQNKDTNKAFNDYSNAVHVNPRYAPGYVGRGNVYLSKKDISSAYKEYSSAAGIDPKLLSARLGIGDVYRSRGDKEAALKNYQDILKIDSSYAPVYTRIGDLYLNNYDNREAAILEYEKAANFYKKNGQIDFYNEVSNILNKLNRYIIYEVGWGDSLGKISQSYGVSMRLIISANRLTYPNLATNPDKIEVGWKFKIPQ